MLTDELLKLLESYATHRWVRRRVELKSVGQSLSPAVIESICAFANSDGGVLVLGANPVGESSQGLAEIEAFGVTDPYGIVEQLKTACDDITPPLRPSISVARIGDAWMVITEVEPLEASQRPAFQSDLDPSANCFHRVGTVTQALEPNDVQVIRQAGNTTDFSAQALGMEATIDYERLEDLLSQVRSRVSRFQYVDDKMLATHLGIFTYESATTVAGALCMSLDPSAVIEGARIIYQRDLVSGETSHNSQIETFFAGPIPELVDQVVSQVISDTHVIEIADLDTAQEAPDLPKSAVEETIWNAIIHRSYAPASISQPIEVHLSEESLTITSPGGPYLSTRPETAGIAPSSGVRNRALSQIVGQLRKTNRADRSAYNYFGGIAKVDAACRVLDKLPPLFFDDTVSWTVFFSRRGLDLTIADELISDFGIKSSDDSRRMVAAALRLEQLSKITELAPTLDAHFAARLIESRRPYIARRVATELETAGVFRRMLIGDTESWTITPVRANSSGSRPSTPLSSIPSQAPEPKIPSIATTPIGPTSTRDRVPDLISVLAQAPGGEMKAKDIGTALGLSSPNSRSRWIRRAIGYGLIEPTKASAWHPEMTYRLTSIGWQQSSSTMNKSWSL